MRGKPFTKGDPRAGRPPGSLNKTSLHARELAQKLVSDPVYLERLKERLVEGKLGHLEVILWQYSYGSPPSYPIMAESLMFESLPGFGSGVDEWNQPREPEDEPGNKKTGKYAERKAQLLSELGELGDELA